MTDFLFITGKLATEALEAVLERMSPAFSYRIAVLNISVAALMHTGWIADRLPADAHGCGKIVIPGACKGRLSDISGKAGVPAVRGPKDLKDLPVFFGGKRDRKGYGEYRTRILAEITEAHCMSDDRIVSAAETYRKNGADMIDLGGPAQGPFPGVARVVRLLKDRGFSVSLDSFDPETILCADRAGIDLLLSVNGQNIDLAPRLSCPVVVIPDFGKGMASLEENARKLDRAGVSYVMDPILNPMGFGLADSVKRYCDLRRRRPHVPMLMGIGNVTELTDADSTGINAVMAGIATELNIDYVLTTEVIAWARGAVREFDLARQLMFYAQQNRTLPKHIDDRLITVKDPPYAGYSETELRAMHQKVSDANYRIFTDDRTIFVFNRDRFIRASRPQDIFAQLAPVDATHAFYLGRELERAYTAVRLKKRYCQDQDLRWGYLSEHWTETGETNDSADGNGIEKEDIGTDREEK